jgi:hypothetical protein
LDLAFLAEPEGIAVDVPFSSNFSEAQAKGLSSLMGRATDGGLAEGSDLTRMMTIANPKQSVEGLDLGRGGHGCGSSPFVDATYNRNKAENDQSLPALTVTELWPLRAAMLLASSKHVLSLLPAIAFLDWLLRLFSLVGRALPQRVWSLSPCTLFVWRWAGQRAASAAVAGRFTREESSLRGLDGLNCD